MDFRVLGPLAVVDDQGQPVALGGSRPRAVLAALVLDANRDVASDRLIDAVWGASPPASAASALQVHVHALRKALGASWIETAGSGYRLAAEPRSIDASEFERLVREGEGALRRGDAYTASRVLGEALDLWRGDALGDLAGHDAFAVEVRRLEERRLEAVELRIEADLALARHGALVPELEKLVRDNPLRERLRAHQMLALYRSDRQADALEAYRAAREALDELGLRPSQTLRDLERQILEHDPSLDIQATAGVDGDTASSSELIGRELELAAVLSLLRRSDTRLLTLTGIGGVGKTTLARAAAAALGEHVFVDLSALSDAELVLSTIASALEVDAEPSGSLLSRVATELDGTRLLVLDNLEHLPGAFPVVAALLDGARAQTVLATSRVPLRIQAERVHRVPPLAVPEIGAATAGELAGVASAVLYAERASEAVGAFEIDDTNAHAITRVCRAVDGIPLAIELAAARARVLGPDEIARRVGESVAVLSRTAPDLPDRRRSVLATLDWSYGLLDPGAARVFRSSAVFAGGARLDALEAVAGEGVDVPTGLETLLDAGLVVSSSTGSEESRFDVLEIVREHALSSLEATGETEATRQAHLDWFLHVAEGDGPEYWRRGTPWLDRVQPEHDNMRAALSFATESGSLEKRLRLAAALRHFWRVRGHVSEGREHLERAFADAAGVAPELEARVTYETGTMRFAAGEYDATEPLWLRTLELWTEIGDRREQGRIEIELGVLAAAREEPGEAVRWYERGRESLAHDDFLLQIVVSNLGAAYEGLGMYADARAANTEALAVQERLGDEDGIAITNFNLASLSLVESDLGAAGRHLGVAIETAVRIGFEEVVAYCLGLAAELALRLERPLDARLLLDSSRARFAAAGASPQGPEEARNERVGSALDALGIESSSPPPPDEILAQARVIASLASERGVSRSVARGARS